MALAVHCSARWVSLIESGARQPSPELVARIADRLGVGLDVITTCTPECAHQPVPSSGRAA